MSDYIHADDGKIHTRYSDLVRCTPGQVQRLLSERLDGLERVETADMAFGTERHEMFAQESLRTNFTAACFPTRYDATYIEKEFTCEIMQDVILHSRPDVVSLSNSAVIDYKTMVAADMAEANVKANRMYGGSAKQLPVYSYQLGINGIMIKKLIYLVEVWDKPRENILGYVEIIKDVNMAEIAKVLPWVFDRCAMLAAAVDERLGVEV